MVLKGKEKAVVALVFTIVGLVIGVLLHFSGLPADMKPLLELLLGLLTAIGTPLGVYNTENSVPGDHEAVQGEDTTPSVEPSTNL